MAAQDQISRTVFTVIPVDGGWAVQHGDALSGKSRDKAEVIAAANKLARTAMSGGVAVQVRIDGEAGYF